MIVMWLYCVIVQTEMFDKTQMTGALVPIAGTDPLLGPWEHVAFAAQPLPDVEPPLTGATYRQVARARAALATLDSTARQLKNPSLLRRPVLRREAQSTSALEGTYAPLAAVLAADEDEPATADLREILNYLTMAEQAFAWLGEGRPVTPGLLSDLQGVLVRGTPSAERWSGQLRGEQVVIGRRPGASAADLPVHAARFIPAPPGQDLEARIRDLVNWMNVDHREGIDPVVAAAMTHYQFEALHPFYDGNGRVGRLLVVMQLLYTEVLTEPTLSVSPWFEARRSEYYDRLFGVSTRGDWDQWVAFFSRGLEASAVATHQQMLQLLAVRDDLLERVEHSTLRSATALRLVDLSVSRTSFTVKQAAADLEVGYSRANTLIAKLVDLEVLAPVLEGVAYDRRFYAPAVNAVLLRG